MFTHDCTNCIPLGKYEDYDLYYCSQPHLGIPTVIARYGNEGSAYISGFPSKFSSLTEARLRWARIQTDC